MTLAPAAEALLARTYDAVLFDMDGTLIDSTPAVVRSWTRWAREEGVPQHDLAGWHGVPAGQIVAALLPTERHAAAIARLEAIELEDTDGVVVLPGAAEALRALAPDRAAIATSCTRPLARVRVAAAGLSAPGVFVTADDVKVGKPDPEPYRLAAQRLGFDPSRCLAVEDAPQGLASARSAGCVTFAVTTTYPAGDLDADLVLRTLADVCFTVADGGVRCSPAPDRTSTP